MASSQVHSSSVVFWAVLSIFFVSGSALSPFPSSTQLNSDPVSLEDSRESCDSPCYHNRNIPPGQQQPNITFLCGSDGFTYLNFEELSCVRRQCGKYIEIRQYGRCPRVVSLSSSEKLAQTPISLPPPSSNYLQSSHNNYNSRLDRNFLKFLSQQSRYEAPLMFPGETVDNSMDSNNRYRNYWQPRPNEGRRTYKKICLPAECNCPNDIIQPVCGSDSVTYGSECLLECSRECKPDLFKQYEGYCRRSFQTTTCDPNHCNCQGEEYDETTGLQSQPICGNDGITYGNMCLLECKKKCKPDLRPRHIGYCGRFSYSQIFQQ